ncbi:hypothetical protein A0H81_11705 [Grifola frondosa]|uniref:Uncharacterized protein n=1 Tax=Grifola frondosa TaxID=5627 RepID=A0A1C7LTP7_GRIFR|nr:hypothetical protein A0H81_11705 [Grifola frondosa]
MDSYRANTTDQVKIKFLSILNIEALKREVEHTGYPPRKSVKLPKYSSHASCLMDTYPKVPRGSEFSSQCILSNRKRATRSETEY